MQKIKSFTEIKNKILEKFKILRMKNFYENTKKYSDQWSLITDHRIWQNKNNFFVLIVIFFRKYRKMCSSFIYQKFNFFFNNLKILQKKNLYWNFCKKLKYFTTKLILYKQFLYLRKKNIFYQKRKINFIKLHFLILFKN